MTTGSISKNELYRTVSAGDLYKRDTRTWNGADSPSFPPREKVYQDVTIPGRTLLNGTVIPELKYRKRLWNNEPARVQRRAKGENYYSLVARSSVDACMSFRYGGSAYVNEFVISSMGAEDNTLQWTNNDQLALIAKLRNEIAGSDFNAGVAIAEAPLALAMIGDSAKRIAGALTSLKRGNVFKAWNYLVAGRDVKKGIKFPSKTDASAAWLQMQYGWKPLLDDTVGCAQFLAHNYDYPRQYVVKVKRFAGGVREHFDNVLVSGYPYNVNLYLTRTTSRSRQIRALITDVNVRSLSGLTDPASIAWEIIPYSFVADWFIPIGSYLDALRLQRSVTATYVTTERIRLVSASPHMTTQSNVQDYHWIEKAEGLKVSRINFTRTISNNLDVPLPSVKPICKIASLGHAYNAVALLVQRHGSR